MSYVDDPDALRDMMLDYICDLMREHEGSGFRVFREHGLLVVRDEEDQQYDITVFLVREAA